MALVLYKPRNRLAQQHNGIDRSLRIREASDVSANWIPPVDVEEHEERFQLYVDLPGVAASDVKITLQAGVLTISGERLIPVREQHTIKHARRERGLGSFHRQFVLPDCVDSENVTATERNGVFEITIPKQAAARPRRIEIAA